MSGTGWYRGSTRVPGVGGTPLYKGYHSYTPEIKKNRVPLEASDVVGIWRSMYLYGEAFVIVPKGSE
jgi:hypothetical protein